jgi:hypothetical protein
MLVKCNRDLNISKGSFRYEFKGGEPVEVLDEHLEFLPNWGGDGCEFQAVSSPKPERKKKIKEVKSYG